MTNENASDAPSALYRQQISNIAAYMWRLTTEATLRPLHNMTRFNRVQIDFSEAKHEAYLCCSDMDNASIQDEETTDKAATSIMTKMVRLTHDAKHLIDHEPKKTPEG